MCMQKVDALTLAGFTSNTSIVSFYPIADNVTQWANVTGRAMDGFLASLVSCLRF